MSLSRARLGQWRRLDFFEHDYLRLKSRLDAENHPFLPAPEDIFAALERTQPEDTRVVVLGQDPYPTPGHAHGFAFSAHAETHPLPRSLGNIFKEMRADLGSAPETADIRFWADQGVLLLNTILTVPPGQPKGHAHLGWQDLTSQILARLDDRPRAFLLWGASAQSAAKTVDPAVHFKIETAHPSPLSARRGFFGSRPFSRVNGWLQAQGMPSINWTQPPTT